MFIIVREKLGAPVFLPLCALRFRHHNDVLHTSCTRVNNRTKDILKQPSRFNRKWVEREREPERHGNTAVVFFLNERINKSFYGLPSSVGRRQKIEMKGKRREEKKQVDGRRERRWGGEKREKMQMWRNRILWSEWAPAVHHSNLKWACCHGLLPAIIMVCRMWARGGKL